MISNNKDENYKKFCEVLFSNWFQHQFKNETVLSELFQMDYAPEPYFIVKEGNNPLHVLLTNPGSGMEFQHIKNHKDNDYKKFANTLGAFYTSEDFKKYKGAAPAYRRIMKSIEFASFLKHDGVINIETIPFHSVSLNKLMALITIQQSKTLMAYQNELRNYLSDKAVLIVSACNTKEIISKDTIRNSKWLKYQCDLANIVVDDLEFEELTEKNQKITSALFRSKNKYIVLMMGSNNLPSLK